MFKWDFSGTEMYATGFILSNANSHSDYNYNSTLTIRVKIDFLYNFLIALLKIHYFMTDP